MVPEPGLLLSTSTSVAFRVTAGLPVVPMFVVVVIGIVVSDAIFCLLIDIDVLERKKKKKERNLNLIFFKNKTPKLKLLWLLLLPVVDSELIQAINDKKQNNTHEKQN